MCKCKCDTPEEGVLLDEDFIAVPVSYYEELIRAQTERDILEATIEEKTGTALNRCSRASRTPGKSGCAVCVFQRKKARTNLFLRPILQRM